VIGVGALDIIGEDGASEQSYDVDDGRIKPDIQGPTDYRPLPPPDPARLEDQHRLFQTSGATPIVGGAAALLRAWLASRNPPTNDAGQVYARLILAGQKVDFGDDDGIDGAGKLSLSGDGHQWWGKVAVRTGTTATITLNVPDNVDRIDAACWWPEPATLGPEDAPRHAPHNRITLRLLPPSGRGDTSDSWTSVFQRVQLDTSRVAGRWQLIISGKDVPTNAPQTVYWAAYGRVAATKRTQVERGVQMKDHSADAPAVRDSSAATPAGTDDDSPPDLTGSIPGWLSELQRKRGRQGPAIFLQGYVGTADAPDKYYRLYLDTGLNRYLDIPRDKLILHLQAPPDLVPLGLMYFWIDGDAAVIVGGAHSTTAHLLNGPISREYGGDAPAWNSPGSRPAPGGGGPSLVPGCAPSSSCGSPVCPH
jgi:hypothetical protein